MITTEIDFKYLLEKTLKRLSESGILDFTLTVFPDFSGTIERDTQNTQNKFVLCEFETYNELIVKLLVINSLLTEGVDLPTIKDYLQKVNLRS